MAKEKLETVISTVMCGIGWNMMARKWPDRLFLDHIQMPRHWMIADDIEMGADSDILNK